MNKKIFQFVFIAFILISSSYSINLEINGEINEYSSIYTENISINLDCNEDISIQTPSRAKNIYFNKH